MTTEALKPCPFCGGTDLAIETDRVMPDDYHNGHVYCSDCDAEGAAAISVNDSWLASQGEAKAAAITAWNTRPTPLAPWTREELARGIDPSAWSEHRVGTHAGRAVAQQNAYDTADRILSRPAPTVCPDGWKLVPTEPTPDQTKAALQSYCNSMDNRYSPGASMDGAIRAALATAPLPPLQKVEGES